MRIISFNILEGGVDSRGNRLEKILSLLTRYTPDILALQEANRFKADEDNQLQRFSEEMNLPFSALSTGALYDDGQRYHATTLSRYPLLSSYGFPDASLQSAALRTVIESPLGVLSITNMHLHAYSEDARTEELRQILGVKDETEHRILLGDLNSLSRTDDDNETELDCEARYDITDTLSVDYTDAATLSENGKTYTHPTELGDPNPCYTNPRRIDYCFISDTLTHKLTAFETIAGGLAEQTSDHRPIVAEFSEP